MPISSHRLTNNFLLPSSVNHLLISLRRTEWPIQPQKQSFTHALSDQFEFRPWQSRRFFDSITNSRISFCPTVHSGSQWTTYNGLSRLTPFEVTLVTDFTFHRISILFAAPCYQRSPFGNHGNCLITVQPHFRPYKARVTLLARSLALRPLEPAFTNILVNTLIQTHVDVESSTSIKLVDTRITDRTLHSDGNRTELRREFCSVNVPRGF